MKALIAALIAGILFGLGLTLSQMVNPEKVMAFLDITGNWDPSLALVMAGAVAVSTIGFALAGNRDKPFLSTHFAAPTAKDIDKRLLGGAAIFGIGWGLAGYCPGPVVAALSFGNLEPVIFIGMLIIGSMTQSGIDKLRQSPSTTSS